MKHLGKLPPAVIGELRHVLNNEFGIILLNAEAAGGEHAERIADAVRRCAEYLRSLDTKDRWNSNPFETERKAG